MSVRHFPVGTPTTTRPAIDWRSILAIALIAPRHIAPIVRAGRRRP